MDDKALQDAVEDILWDEFGPWRMDDSVPIIASVTQKIMEAVRARMQWEAECAEFDCHEPDDEINPVPLPDR